MSHKYVIQNNNWYITDTHPKYFGSLALWKWNHLIPCKLKAPRYTRWFRLKVAGTLPSKANAGTSRGNVLRFQIECQKGLFREVVPLSSTVPSSMLVFLPPESDGNKHNATYISWRQWTLTLQVVMRTANYIT